MPRFKPPRNKHFGSVHKVIQSSEGALNTEEIEVVELFDEQGQSMLFELLAQINTDGNDYFLLTVYLEDTSEIDTNTPADVFVMKQVENNCDKMLEPLDDPVQMEKVFSIFKDMNRDNFDFVN